MSFPKKATWFLGGMVTIVALATVAFLFSLFFNLGGRSGYNSDSILAANLATALAKGESFRLAGLPGYDFRWDRVYFIQAYTPGREVVRRTGVPGTFRIRTVASVQDGYTLLVFTRGHTLSAYFVWPELSGTFSREVLRAEGFALALGKIFDVAKGVDAKTMSLQYLEALKVMGEGPATKFIIPLEFSSLLTSLLADNKLAFKKE